MRLLITITLILCVLIPSHSLAMGIVIVANEEQSEVKVDRVQLRDLFMGNSSEFDLTPIALAPVKDARTLFNTKVIGLTESRIQSYWAQMRFSGRKKPPLQLKTEDEVIARLLSTKNAIAYLPANTELPDGIVVLYRVN